MSPATAAPHVPVLLDEVIAGLDPKPGETHVDGTFGAGGYTKAILNSGARVYAFDRDPDAIREGVKLADESGERLTLVPERFSRMRQALADRGVDAVDGVTLDIGVSSMQLDRPERGFSFQADGPLDMRMSREGRSAADFLNEADEEEIADVLYRYGEEPKSRRVARAIVAARPIERTGQLAAVVRKALGHHPGMKKDPATRTFQAIRIHLNEELEELEGGLAAAEHVLRPGGRLAVVTFHSLEDRVVKRFLRERSGAVPAASRHLPVQPKAGPKPT
ncbi:MAG TPA: 16S rRNA (cytosine(1402)-N(4))-methyltransferase RsmH, partial [Allosphingosinicella sp.]|nr:16S rRNA (cytosine(1402)-N(4))-methyltransferase RsmH [Allosphingosinicella sp.]